MYYVKYLAQPPTQPNPTQLNALYTVGTFGILRRHIGWVHLRTDTSIIISPSLNTKHSYRYRHSSVFVVW